MKKLCKAETNAMTMYFVEDMETDKAVCVDWDLSADEETELISSFESGTLDESANGGEYQDIDTAYTDTFCKTVLAYRE